MIDFSQKLESLDSILARQNEFHAVVQGGVKPDLQDERDYNAEQLVGDNLNVLIDWNKGYDATSVWPTMPNQNQEQQYSCTGRAASAYKQVLQAADTGEQTMMSAKSIYNPIADPGVGAYIRDAMIRTVNYGVNKESSVPSEGTEAEITAHFDFGTFASEANYYKNSVVASISSQDFETLAKMILLNHGFVSGWGNHCQYFKAFGTKEGKRFLQTHGSYGEGSDMFYVEGEPQPLFSIWTAVDVKNIQGPVPSPIPTFQFLNDLTEGQHHPDVVHLNDRLTVEWPLTDYYSPQTSKKVAQYIREKGIGSLWYRYINPGGRVLDKTVRDSLNNPLFKSN